MSKERAKTFSGSSTRNTGDSLEAWGAHYLQMIGAIGGSDCTAKGTALSEYENAHGTGNIHIWFDVHSAIRKAGALDVGIDGPRLEKRLIRLQGQPVWVTALIGHAPA